MARLKRNKKNKCVSQTDFTLEKLPHNRAQVFQTTFRLRFGFVINISFFLTLFCLPLIVWNIFGAQNVRGLILTLADDGSNSEAIMKDLFSYSISHGLVSLPLFCIAGIGFGGAIHVFQLLVWNEMVFLSDFFDAIKKNFIHYLLSSLPIGFSFAFFLFVIFGVPLTSLESFSRMVVYGIGVIQLCLIGAFTSFVFLQREYYNLAIKNLLMNSFKFTLKSLFPSLFFLLIIAMPSMILLFDNTIIDFISIPSFVLVSGPGLIGLILAIDTAFDKNINKEQFPSIYDRGIYR